MRGRITRPLLLGVLLFGAVGIVAQAQSYPQRPVRIIVPFGAGGANDVVVRIVAARLSDVLGQQVVVDNRTGAGGLIGTEIAAKAAPDGYTLLGTATPHVIFPHLHKKMPFDTLRDFTPIMQIGGQPYAITAHPSLAVSTIKELIAAAQKEPGRINQHKAGQLRIIAVTSAKRSRELPDIPSIAETVPGYDASLWSGLLAPRGTPPAIIDRLHRDISKLLQSKETQDAFEKVGTYVVSTNPKAFGEYIEAEFVKWRGVVRAVGLQIN